MNEWKKRTASTIINPFSESWIWFSFSQVSMYPGPFRLTPSYIARDSVKPLSQYLRKHQGSSFVIANQRFGQVRLNWRDRSVDLRQYELKTVLWVAFTLCDPPPPREFSMREGGEEGKLDSPVDIEGSISPECPSTFNRSYKDFLL